MKRKSRPPSSYGPGLYLQRVILRRREVPSFDAYPFCIPAIRNLNELDFDPGITFLVGENGAGKSTLLEAIAVKMGFNAEGGSLNFNFATVESHSPLSSFLTLARPAGKPGDGYFLRAESFYNVASEIDRLGVARAYGGKSLHEQSHGEAFISLLNNRLQGGGLYFFDEPEAALSPQRQLAVLSLLHRLVQHRSQLVIATHSPILLAFPGARILSIDESGISPVAYEDTDHFHVTRDFLNNHRRMTDLLIADEEDHLRELRRPGDQ